MNKPWQIGLLAAVIVLAIGALAFTFIREAASGGGGSTWSSEQIQVREALEKVGGDPNKLDPETKKRYDKIVEENPLSSARRAGAPQ
jgi:hypothetical protein